jgi:hypothetical protein
VHFTENNEQVVSCSGIGIMRKLAGYDAPTELQGSYIQCRQDREIGHVRSREEGDIVDCA